MRRFRLASIVLVICVSILSVSASAQTRGLARDLDPVIVAGSQMPIFHNLFFNRLFVYAYRAGGWEQIPWQFDELQGGRVVAVENGRLDGDDQLVVMAGDAGDRAPARCISECAPAMCNDTCSGAAFCGKMTLDR